MTEKASQDEWLSEGQYLLPADDLLLSASEVQPLVSAVKSFVVLDLIRVSTLS